jgi:hypothetical protein
MDPSSAPLCRQGALRLEEQQSSKGASPIGKWDKRDTGSNWLQDGKTVVDIKRNVKKRSTDEMKEKTVDSRRDENRTGRAGQQVVCLDNALVAPSSRPIMHRQVLRQLQARYQS